MRTEYASTGTGAAAAVSQSKLMLFLLLAPALIWLVGLIVLPHLDLAVLSLRARVGPRQYEPSLAQYRTFIEEPLYWHTFVRTALMSILATLITLLLAFPVAWTIAKLVRGRTKSLLLVMCLIPFWVSETVRTLGWMILLRESGVLPAVLVTGSYGGAGRNALSGRDHFGRPGLHLDVVHGGAAHQRAGKPGRRFD